MNEELNLKQVFADFVNFVSRNNKLIILCMKTFDNGYELRKKTLQRNLNQRKQKVIGLS